MKKIRAFIARIQEIIEDIGYEIQWGSSFRFILASLILNERLRETVSFSVIDLKTAKKVMDIDPEFAKRKLDQVIEMLQELPKP